MKQTRKTNSELAKVLEKLDRKSFEGNVKLWRAVADLLRKPTRMSRIANLFKISRYSKENETVIIPGKVLGTGELNHKLTVAALSFSSSAREKIGRNGSAISISELLEKNPKGSNVRIIG